MITLNAFTNGFHGFPSMIGIGEPRLVRWVYGESDWDGIAVFEDSWMYHPDGDAVRSRRRVGWLVEPRALRPINYERAMGVRHKFDMILTYDAELLAADPAKFKLCPRMGLHVPRADWGFAEKTAGVGMITTTKRETVGHTLRRQVAERFGRAGAVAVYGASGFADKVQSLRSHRFALIVESERASNLFTEHLLDTIALGCIPVYWGCPNIGDWLDESGIISWSAPDELDGVLARCTPELYARMLPAAIRNMSRLPDYLYAEDWACERYFEALAQ